VGSSMDVRDVGVALWRQRLLILVVLLIGGAVVAGGLLVTPKTYEASARVEAAKEPTSTITPTALDQVRADLAQLAVSAPVLNAVRLRLDLDDRSTAELQDEVTATWQPNVAHLEITVRDPDPRNAARIANAVAAELAGRDPSEGVVTLTVSRRATTPTVFVDPPLGRVLGGGLGACLLLALLLALARNRRTETVESATDVENAAVAPLLAHLIAPADLTSMPALRPGSAEADMFRHLRLALEAETSGGPSKKVVVAGVSAGEVDVWLGANAAISLAIVGRRVLLVDGRMGDRFGRPSQPGPDTLGLYDVLNGADLDRAVSPGPVEMLSVLPSGTWAADLPASLLEHAFDGVMAEAAARFDVVVVLAPPLDQADDARQMAVAGSLLLAVPEGGVSATALRSHATRVRTAGGRILGVVLIGGGPESTAA
jgi:succinoglycan biosynthesis transport protein ExoP